MASTMSGGRCQGCGKRIVWGETKDGARVPLDPVPPVYKFVNGYLERVDASVSHFATCSVANKFSRGNK